MEDFTPIAQAAKLRGVPMRVAIREASLRWALRVLKQERKTPA